MKEFFVVKYIIHTGGGDNNGYYFLEDDLYGNSFRTNLLKATHYPKYENCLEIIEEYGIKNEIYSIEKYFEIV